MSEKDPRDPFADFPGGSPFGPGGPFAPGSGDPFAGMDTWLRGMGVDPSEFRRLVEDMQKSLHEALRSMGDDPSKAFVHGFNVRVGPDGKPHFSSFGNKPSVQPGPGGLPGVRADEREPLTDVIEDTDQVAVTMELPGVDKKDIDLHVTEETMEVAVDTEQRKYHKRVRMPGKVDPTTTKATFKNGILDVTVRKEQRSSTGLRVDVE